MCKTNGLTVATTGGKVENAMFAFLNHNMKSDPSQAGLHMKIVHGVAEDVAFAWKLSHLHNDLNIGAPILDGGLSVRGSPAKYEAHGLTAFPLSEFKDLIPEFVLPFLPPRPSHVLAQASVMNAVAHCTDERLQAMQDLN